jgi:hypothetical protein
MVGRREQAERLSVELERAALRAIRATYDDLNASFFKRRLQRPVLALSDTDARLGRWVAHERTLELSRLLLLEHDWGTVVEVLKHEMAHQFVAEVLGITNESAHGPAFRQVCTERAIDARAAGVPARGGAPVSESRVLERVAKLLALAESPNVHEAQAAMAAAQRLMLKHNIDSIAERGARAYAFRHVGLPSGRVPEHERLLALIIGDHFFVEAIWVPVWRPREGKRGSVLEVCGTVENVELAAYVHAFLSQTSERLWAEYKRAHRLKANAERRTFLAGVMAGFRSKLDRQKRDDRGRGLVWLGDADLSRYFRQRHPHIRWSRHSCGQRSDAYAHGHKAGREIVLHRGVRQGASGTVRLLPSGRRS